MLNVLDGRVATSGALIRPCSNNFRRERTIYGVSRDIYRGVAEIRPLNGMMTLRGMWNASSFPCAMTMDRILKFPHQPRLPFLCSENYFRFGIL